MLILPQQLHSEAWNMEYVGSGGIHGEYYDVRIGADDIGYFTNRYGLVVADLADREEPEILNIIPTVGKSSEMELRGALLYVCDGYNGLLVYDLAEDPQRPELISQTELPVAAQMLVTDDFIVVYQPHHHNMYLFSMENPRQPELVSAPEIRDPTSICNLGSLLYVCTDDPYDYLWSIEDLRHPRRIFRFEPSAFGGYGTIDQQDSIYYTSGYSIYSLIDPFAPERISRLEEGHNGDRSRIFGDLLGACDDAYIFFYDVADPTDPQFLSRALCDYRDYIWARHANFDISDDLLVTTNKGYGFTLYDINQIDEPEVSGWYDERGSVLDIVKKDNVLIVKDKYYNQDPLGQYVELDRLVIYNLDDPMDPQISAVIEDFNFDIFKMFIRDDMLFLSGDQDGNRRFGIGIKIIEISDPTNPVEIGRGVRQDPPGEENDINSRFDDFAVSGDYIYIVGSSVVVVSIADIENPEMVEYFHHQDPEYGDHSTRVYVYEDHLYICDQYVGLRIYSLEDPEQPELLTILPQGNLESYEVAAFHGDYLYVARRLNGVNGFSVIDVSNPTEAFHVRQIHQIDRSSIRDLRIENNLLFVSNAYGGVYIYSLDEPSYPELAGRYDTPGKTYDTACMDQYLYVADTYELGVYDIAPILVGQLLTPSERSHDFSDILIDDSASWQITITNRDNVSHEISELRLDSEVFECDFEEALELQPGDETSFEITFSPVETGIYEDHLFIVSGDVQLDIPIHGRGIPPWEDDGNSVGSRVCIGRTWFDVQSNGNPGRTLTVAEDGSVHAVWTKGFNSDLADERHVFYNYLIDGAPQFEEGVAVDQARRAGFTNIDYHPQVGVVPVFHIADENNSFRSCLASDLDLGRGEFTVTDIPNNDENEFTWPHMTLDRNGSAHLFARQHDNNMGLNDLLYSRFGQNEEGEWELEEQELATQLTTISYTPTASAESDKVALAYLASVSDRDDIQVRDGWHGQANMDLFVVESDDGENFDWANPQNVTQFIRPDPNVDPESPFYQGDTLRCYSFVDACYDAEDNLHVIFSTVQILEPITEEDQYEGHPARNMIWHWDRDSDSVHLVANGWYQYGGYLSNWQSNLSYPSISAGEDGKLYCIFTAFPNVGQRAHNDFVNGELFATVSEDGGQSWARATNLTRTSAPDSRPGDGRSECWGSLAKHVDDNLHILYVLDLDPGSAPEGDGTVTNNPVIYHQVPTEEIATEPLVEDRSLHIERPPLASQVVSFAQGWNMISLNISPDDSFWIDEQGPDIIRLTEQLRNEEGIQRLLLLKDERGRFYSPAHDFNGIPFYNLSEGYQFKVTETFETTWNGDRIPADADVPLEEGWNIIPYYPHYELSADAPDFHVLLPIIEEVYIAKDGNGRFMVPRHNYSNMQPWRPGQGYQVKVTEDVILNYPQEQERNGVASVKAMTHSPSSYSDIFNESAFEPKTNQNMSILISKIDVNQSFDASCGDQIKAFSTNGLLCGSGIIDQDGRCGLAVWGDDPTTDPIDGMQLGETIMLKLIDEELDNEFILEAVTVHNGVGPVYEPNGLTVMEMAVASNFPKQYYLSAVYPNPFNNVTKIQYGLPHDDNVVIKIYDVMGHEVVTLVDAPMRAGHYSNLWNGHNEEGIPVSSGVYIYRIQTEHFVRAQKMTLIK